MVLKTVISTWLAFHVIYFTVWNESFSQVSTFEVDQKNHDEHLYSDLACHEDCNEVTEPKYSEENQCSLEGINSTMLSYKADCVITDEVLEEILFFLNATYEFTFDLPTALSRYRGLYSGDEEEGYCEGLGSQCKNESRSTSGSQQQHSLRYYLQHTSQQEDPACQQLVENIKNITMALYNEVPLIMAAINPNSSKLLLKIAQLEGCINWQKEQLDDILKQAEEQGKCYTSAISEVYTCFATELNKKVEQIEQLQQVVDTTTLQVVVSNVLASRYTEAVIGFQNLSKAHLLDELLEMLYKNRQMEHILSFGFQLYKDSISDRFFVYNKTHTLMKASTVPDHLHNIMFHTFVQRDLYSVCHPIQFCAALGNATIFQGFMFLMQDLIPAKNSSLDNWAQLIEDGTIQSIITLGSPEAVNLTGTLFHDVVEQLVTTQYNKDGNINKTLDFVSALRWNNQTYKAYETLLGIIPSDNTEHELLVAYKMKEAMLSLNGPDEQQMVIQKKFEELRDKVLRPNVRAVIWGNECTFQATGNGNLFLFADNEAQFEAGNRRVMAKVEEGDTSKWKLETIEMAQNVYEFRLENVGQSGELLGSHVPWRWQNFDSPGFEYCCTSSPSYMEAERKYYNWEIRFSDSSDDEVRLFHVGRQAYLHSHSDEDEEKKSKWVYLDMYGRASENTRWKISCT